MAKNKSFAYLYIPCDDSIDIEERTISFAPENEIGCLTQTLSKHFALIQGSNSAATVQNSMYQILEKQAAEKGIDISDDEKAKILSQIAQSQMVDIVPLQLATKNNNWTAVSMYVDDKGATKGVPVNMRATNLSHACGRGVRVMGDAFVARAQDDNRDLYHRKNFLKSEFSPSASWVLAANKEAGGRNVQNLTGGSGGKSGSSSNKKVDPEKLNKYKEQLETWVQGKLTKWNNEESFRNERIKKYETKDGFEQYLRRKVEKKLASFK
jgi:hypothetical protein